MVAVILFSLLLLLLLTFLLFLLLLWFYCSCCFVLVVSLLFGCCFIVVVSLLLSLSLFHCSTLSWVHCCCHCSCFIVVVVVVVVISVVLLVVGLLCQKLVLIKIRELGLLSRPRKVSDLENPKIGSDGFGNLFRSDELNNQSEVDISANENGSDLKNQIAHLIFKTDYHYMMIMYSLER